MPTLLSDVPEMAAAAPHRKSWTRDQCALLEAAGVFERERLELVDADLASKMGKNRQHVNAVMLILVWRQKTFGDAFCWTRNLPSTLIQPRMFPTARCTMTWPPKLRRMRAPRLLSIGFWMSRAAD